MRVDEKRIANLQRQNESLTRLLQDQHPGLTTWIGAVCDAVNEMKAIIDGKRDE